MMDAVRRTAEIMKDIMLAAACLVLAAALICFILHLKPVVVLSGSMEPEIKTGALAFIDTGERNVGKGTVAAFEIEDQMITHRIVRKTDDGYVTKGDANEDEDPWRIGEDRIRGVTRFSIPVLGYVVKDVTSTTGIVILITLFAAAAAAEAFTGRRK